MSAQKKRKVQAAFQEVTSPITNLFKPVGVSSPAGTTSLPASSPGRRRGTEMSPKSPLGSSSAFRTPSPGVATKSAIKRTVHIVDVTDTPSPKPSSSSDVMDVEIVATTPTRKSTQSSMQSGADVIDLEEEDIDVFDMSTPLKQIKKRHDQKPITPSSTMKSSMNNSLVFDIVTSLSTNDPDVANSALRSVVALGKEYPTPLLFQELLDHIEGESTYARAVAIYSSMIFVFEQASQCNTTMAFPAEWKGMNILLQVRHPSWIYQSDVAAIKDLVYKPINESWQRSLLVLQFMVHFFQRDMAVCQERFAATNKEWLLQTRLATVLSDEKKERRQIQNNVIVGALGRLVDLWIRVFDLGECTETYMANGEEACLAALRLMEMLHLLTDQVDNAMQKVQSSLQPMSRETRLRFLQVQTIAPTNHVTSHVTSVVFQACQSPTFKISLGTTVLGRTTASRSKELEWFDCIAQGHFVAHQLKAANGVHVAIRSDLYRFADMHLKAYAGKSKKDDKSRQLFKHILRLQTQTR
ncbi:Aste57867_8751 [Aphanomyces stellatus]|uniref:Aste57867_8751 protein n=1 Tax=Aphanomyces stellatus TaxID=120398 RepID=A0A485KL19_9STRA|nr:hypothetical protein As57867_008717 [Aphanomyces stellatus]VFT85637.1 Aste57867_8751 [Aphanomyces stellatus]